MTSSESAPFNPFPGLRPFRENEEYLFFGRERQVSSMVNKLAENRFLAVLGTSGSGKSSLVNCGLRPALHRGLMTAAGSSWRMAQFRPGNDPIHALAHALSETEDFYANYAGAIPLVKLIDTTLRISKRGLLDVFKRAHLPEHTNLLVVVDQFEELFRYQSLTTAAAKNDEGINQEAVAFVNLLLEAVRHPETPVYIVLTMRSDFLGECARFQGLPEAINAGQFLVPRMTREERRSAIEGPVRVGGARITTPLLTQLVNDVGESPDQLSVLQHALNRTWANWEEHGASGPIELKHYEAVGAMTEALDRHAENAYGQLKSDREKKLCELIFKALTDKGTDARGVRRPVKFETLCKLTGAQPSEIEGVIDVFRDPTRSFLMPPAGEKLEPQTVIDISHESLMRIWKSLRRWTEEEARSAQQYRRLAETASLYQDNQARLLRDPELRLSLQWKKENQPTPEWGKRYDPSFDEAMSFLEKSRKKDQLRKLAIRVTGGGVAMFFFVLLTIYAVRARNRAVEFQTQAVEFQSQAKEFRLQAMAQKERAEAQRDSARVLQQQIEALQSQLTGSNENIQTLRIKNRSLKWDIEQLDYQNNWLAENINRINVDISENREIERNLNERIDDFTSAEDSLTLVKKQLASAFEKLQVDEQNLEDHADSLKSRNDTLRLMNDSLRKAAIEARYYLNPPPPGERNAQSLSEDRARAVEQFYSDNGLAVNRAMATGQGRVSYQDSLNAVIQDLRNELALLKMLEYELRELNRRLEEQAQDARMENQRLALAEEEAKQARERLVLDIRALRETEHALIESVNGLKNEIWEIDRDIAWAESQIKFWNREITRLEKENNTLSVENQALETALAKFR